MSTGPTRREKIEAMLADEPDDQFLRYAFAMELEKAGEHERSLEYLRGLMQDEAAHVPAFFMAGQHLAKQDRIDEAREVLRDGIEHARQQGDSHAAGEMSDFLASLGALGE
jgi:predicted Zn-dependent protease